MGLRTVLVFFGAICFASITYLTMNEPVDKLLIAVLALIGLGSLTATIASSFLMGCR